MVERFDGTSPGAPRRRFQIPLAQLIAWVIAAAVIADLVRRTSRGWSVTPIAFDNPDAIFDVLGAVVLGLAVVVVTRLLMQLVWLTRRKDDEASGRPGWTGVAWRLFVLAILAAYCAVQVKVLAQANEGVTIGLYSGTVNRARVQTMVSGGLMLLIGVTLLLKPPAPVDRPGHATRRSLTGMILAGVLGLGVLSSFMAIPYLVLLALEAVSNALRHHLEPVVPLGQRLRDATIPAALALIGCLLTGSWVDRDLRAAAGRAEAEFTNGSRKGFAARGMSLALMLTASVYLMRVTIPYVHSCLDQGIRMVIDPTTATAMVIGLAGLSAGVVARAVAPRQEGPGPHERLGFIWLAGRSLAALILLQLIAMAMVAVLRESGGSSPFDSLTLLTWERSSLRAWDMLWSLNLPTFVWVPASLWAAVVVGRELGPFAIDRISSIELITSSKRLTLRFLGLWAALTALCLCALPTLAVASLLLYRLRLLGWNGQ